MTGRTEVMTLEANMTKKTIDKRWPIGIIGFAVLVIVSPLALAGQKGPFTLEQVRSYPYPMELVASATGSRIAWVFNEQGIRNVWAAEGPDFLPRRLTDYHDDDGQELTNLVFSHQGNYVVYVRGGDHDSNGPAAGNLQPDPGSSPIQPKMEIWSIPFS